MIVQQFDDVGGDLEMVSPLGDLSRTNTCAIEREDTDTEMDSNSPVQKVPSKKMIMPMSQGSHESYF